MMCRRRLMAISVLASLATAITISPAIEADATARAFVTAIYNAYKGKGGHGVSLDSEGVIRRYFEHGLAELIISDRKDAAELGEAPTLTGDPFVDAGDWNIQGFDIAVQDVAPNKARATVKFENFEQPKTVVLDLVKLKVGWRIADIVWQGDSETENLRALLAEQ
jgi:hypothetical protein